MGAIVAVASPVHCPSPHRSDGLSMSYVGCREQDDNDIIFRILLSDADARSAILAYLKHEHSEENLHFYEAVSGLTQLAKQADSEDSELGFLRAFNQIVESYIRSGAPKEINLPQRLSRGIVKMYEGDFGKAGRAMGADVNTKRWIIVKELSKAQKEVIGIVAGILPRFEKHDIYRDFLSLSQKSVERNSLPKMGSFKSFRTSSCRMLLIEKVEMARYVLQRILTGQGIEVKISGNVSEALIMIRAEQFDLVVVDLELTDSAACSIMEVLKAEDEGYLQRSKFVLMSAYPLRMQLEKDSFIALGYRDFLSKPFSNEDISRIRRGPTALQTLGSTKQGVRQSSKLSTRTLNGAEV